MQDFTYIGLPARVVFGSGTLKSLPAELSRLSVSRALIVTTQAQADAGEALSDSLEDLSGGVFSDARMHTPVSVTEAALEMYHSIKANGVVAIGGGSTIGLSKAIALHTDAPQVALPTTYAGSEMTTILGQTEDGQKVTQTSLRVLPETVLYDVDLTLSLPPVMSVTSGLNAIAHAVEAMYAPSANPMLDIVAREGVKALTRALPKISRTPKDPLARSDALYGAWACAMCLGAGGVALHHKLCHVIGGSFDLPHAETHAIILPHALNYNAPAIPEVMESLAEVMGTDDVCGTLFDIANAGGAPTALSDLGMPADGVDDVVAQTLAQPYPNPRGLEAEALRSLVMAAWRGDRPQ